AVHERPAAGGHHRRLDIRSREPALQLPPGAGLHAVAPRGRSEPRQPPHPERAARGDGGAPGEHRRHHLPLAGALLRGRHPEPPRAARHLRPARIATRPLSHAGDARLSRQRARAGAAARRRAARAPLARCAGAVRGGGAQGAARRARRARRRAAPRLRAGADRAHARERAAAWMRRRQGVDLLPVALERRRLYILPTGTGMAFAALLFLMLIAGLNYGNSLALFLTFLLGAFALVAMQQCHRNLLGIAVLTV